MSVTEVGQAPEESQVDPIRTAAWHRGQLVKARERLLTDQKPETLAAYSWPERDQSFVRGWVRPDKEPGFAKLGDYLEGAAVTIIHTPPESGEKIPKGDKKLIFIQMGWGEPDIAGEGFGVDLANALASFDKTGSIDIVLLPQPGSSGTYKDNPGRLHQLGFEDEYAQIEATAKRVMRGYGLGEESVLAVVGHSKGGRYARELKRRGVFAQAAFAYLAPVIIGDKYEGETPGWIKDVLQNKGKHVLLQDNNIAAMMVRMVLAWPDKLWRQRGLQALSKLGIPQAVTRYFVGATAKHVTKR